MTYKKESTCSKKKHQKVGFDLKLSIIDEIKNGLISVNHASKKYNISRSSINYWMQKLATFNQIKKGMSIQQELKKAKERIRALEFIKDLQQDIIADFEKETGEEFSKKYLPEALANAIAKKKKKLTK
jgi:transposase-like protein